METKQNNTPSIFQTVYKTLVSMKFAIVILIILGVTSLMSMLINEYPDFFTEGTLIHQIFSQHSPYSSVWYSILLWFLIISVFLCVIQHIGPTFRSIFKNNFLNTEKITNLESSEQFSAKKVTIDQVKNALKKRFYNIVEKEDDGEKLIVARKFKWSSLGHILTHTSILVIVFGSLIYTKTHRQEFRYIIAQEFADSEYYENFPELFQWHFFVDEDFHPTVVVDSFRVRFYDSNQGPNISDFRSYVRVFDHSGELIKQHEITVNSPLIFGHVSIHQTDYKPLVNEFFMNVPNRNQIVAQAQRNQEFIKDEINWITGLSLRGNKGKSIIFAGMLISAIGLTMAFMFWPRYVWVAQKDDKLTIAGRSIKNKIAFKKELDSIIERIQNE